jgi:hypothetical protein
LFIGRPPPNFENNKINGISGIKDLYIGIQEADLLKAPEDEV